MQNIEEQVNTIERALGERMVQHALVIIHSWLIELGENNPYEETFVQISREYDTLFNHWLAVEDEETDAKLNELTSRTYRLTDAVYAALRIKRGLSPQMHGFNGENPQSVMHYFSSCMTLSERDFDWLGEVFNDSERAPIALMAISALAKNMRDNFSEDGMRLLIEGISASNEVVAEQCLANVMLLLTQYDVRIDFFPALQEAFIDQIEQTGDEGQSAFETLCALLRSVDLNWTEMLASGEASYDSLPEEVRKLIDASGATPEEGLGSIVPVSETTYLQDLIAILPDTWLFDVLVGGRQERERTIAMVYLSIGRMDLVWDSTDEAEQWLLKRLRSDKGKVRDFINYGHCLLLRGDRMMAYENYLQARRMCHGAKEFYSLFRPDRKALVDHGVPMEQVYLLEDQLFTGK